jgi:long-chain fatty acid transport protein
MRCPMATSPGSLTKDLFLGFGVSAPFGLATEYDQDGWAGQAQAIKSEIKTINFNPSVAYRVNDKVSLGFGVNYQTIDGELTSAGRSAGHPQGR